MDIVDTAVIPTTLLAFVQDHAKRYLASNGREGHLSVGGSSPLAGQTVPSLLLVTKGRTSGTHYLMPLYYGADGGRYVVTGSKGGAPVHPGWYKNLVKDPNVRIQVGDKRIDATATTATGAERARLWEMMAKLFPQYRDYQANAKTREIPVVVLTPKV